MNQEPSDSNRKDSQIAARAREALEGITPGPWAWCQYGTQFEVFTESVSIAPDDVADVADNLRHLADAEFIAAAPDLIASLLAALETAETKAHTWPKTTPTGHVYAEPKTYAELCSRHTDAAQAFVESWTPAECPPEPTWEMVGLAHAEIARLGAERDAARNTIREAHEYIEERWPSQLSEVIRILGGVS